MDCAVFDGTRCWLGVLESRVPPPPCAVPRGRVDKSEASGGEWTQWRRRARRMMSAKAGGAGRRRPAPASASQRDPVLGRPRPRPRPPTPSGTHIHQPPTACSSVHRVVPRALHPLLLIPQPHSLFQPAASFASLPSAAARMQSIPLSGHV